MFVAARMAADLFIINMSFHLSILALKVNINFLNLKYKLVNIKKTCVFLILKADTKLFNNNTLFYKICQLL